VKFLRTPALFLSFFCLAALVVFSIPANGAEQNRSVESVSVTIPAGAYEFTNTSTGQKITMDGFGRLPTPGVPMLPAKIFSVAVPPGARVTGVTCEASEEILLPGGHAIKPVPLPRVPTGESPAAFQRDKALFDASYNSVYKNDAFYPDGAGHLVRSAKYRKYDLVDVRVTPFSWNPESGALLYRPAVTINVTYTLPPNPPAAVVDNMVRTEAVARDIIANYDQAQTWYNNGRAGRGLYDLVIITLDSLVAAVQPLVDWETQKGRNVNVVTTTWIYSNYAGYDNAEMIRNFLRDKYPMLQWGIEDVLLVGHYDDVPMRRCSQNVGYGEPETDFYYAELSYPDSQSWDADGDHRWGENNDPIDFYNEVNVGRIPWSDTFTVQHIANKSVAYENNMDPAFKKNILLLGAYFWPDTDNAVLMEYKTDPVIHPWMTDWTSTKLYEVGHTTYNCDYDLNNNNVRDVWSNGKYAFVNWAGHGSPDACWIYYSSGYFIANADCAILNDNYPSIIFADACSNSDTDYLNIGQAMLEQGGVGFLGSTKVAYGMPGWNDPTDGSSQSLDYYFTSKTTSGDYTQGQAHQAALRTMYFDGLWYYEYYEAFEWGALWGNPNLSMGTAPPLIFDFPAGLPEETQPPGMAVTLTVEIRNGLENYVPGTGYFYYRLDPDDTFTQVALTDLGNDLFEAALPTLAPGDEPEYYFSADSDGGQTMTSPFGAPGSCYSCDVCLVRTFFADDFENDLGWKIINVAVENGGWERGDPAGTGGWGDPTDDADGSGQCFVTGNAPTGIDDLDGGPTYLTSPTIDLTLGDAQVSFDMWFYNLDATDPFKILVSNDDGATYTLVEEFIGGSGGWNTYTFNVSDYVTPTSTVKVRIATKDMPNNSTTEAGVDGFGVQSLDFFPSLYADAYSFSAAAGQDIDFFLDAGVANAGRSYLMLATLSGVSPGMDVNGLFVPLTWDWVSAYIYNNLSLPIFQDFQGVLDSQGRAVADLPLYAPGLVPHVGQSLTFVYALTNPIDFASTPVDVEILP